MRKHTRPQETQPFEFLFICIDEDFMFVWVDIFARIQKDHQCNAESTPLTVMNETPISKADKFVCLRVPTGVYLASSTCQTGSRPCVCVKDMITSSQGPTVRAAEVKPQMQHIRQKPSKFPRFCFTERLWWQQQRANVMKQREEQHARTL